MGVTDFQDCQAIIRAYEKGCAFSSDERSVFAMTTPFLQNVMGMAAATQRTTEEILSDTISNIDKELNAEMKKANKLLEDAPSTDNILKEIKKKAGDAAPDTISFDDASTIGGLDNNTGINSQTVQGIGTAQTTNPLDKFQSWDKFKGAAWEGLKKCPPCDLRQALQDIKNFDWKSGLEGILSQLRMGLDAMWNDIIQRFIDLGNMLKGLGQYIDICQFLKFLLEWTCLPDFYRILAALSAALMDIGFFLDGFGIDLVLSFIVPLVLPTLQGFVDLLSQFLVIVLKPLKCFIDGILLALNKLDFSSFKIPDSFTLRAPNFTTIKNRNKTDAEREAEYNDPNKYNPPAKMNIGLGGSIENISNRNWRTMEPGEKIDLSKIEKEFSPFGIGTPKNDPAWTKRISLKQPDLKAFTDKINQFKEWTSNLRNMISSMFMDIIVILRSIIARFEAMIKQFLEEFLKLIEEFVVGYRVSFGRGAMQKLAIINLINIFTTIVKLFISIKDGVKCDEKDIPTMIMEGILAPTGFTVYKDAMGDIHIEEPDAALEPARALLGEIISSHKEGSKILTNTGDPVIDTQLTTIVEKITSPVKVVFGCSQNVSITGVQEVNSWISGV